MSVSTVIALVPITPLALAMRSPRELEREIADRKRAEEALRESEERFRGTFENAAVGIAHGDADGRFLRVNERALRYHRLLPRGAARQDLPGHHASR